MIPHKIPRGAAALGRLKVFDGIPFPYDHKKRFVVPEALKIVRLRDNRKFCKLGDLAASQGWTKKAVVEKLEVRRKEKSQKFWQIKSKKVEAKKAVKGHKEIQQLNNELAQYGF